MHAGMLHSLYCFLLCLQRERFTSRLFPPAEFSPDILRRTITQCAKVSGGIPEYFPRCSMGTEAVRVPGRGPSGGARASPGGSAAVLLAEEGNVFHPHQMLRSKKEKERGKNLRRSVFQPVNSLLFSPSTLSINLQSTHWPRISVPSGHRRLYAQQQLTEARARYLFTPPPPTVDNNSAAHRSTSASLLLGIRPGTVFRGGRTCDVHDVMLMRCA